MPTRLVLVLLAALCVPMRATAAPLEEGDVSLVLLASTGGGQYLTLDPTGYFGTHRCLCPHTLALTLGLTPTAQTRLGSSTIDATFVLGQSCSSSPTTCLTLGSVSFSNTQTATVPTFSSNLIYQAVTRTTAVDCSSLSAGTTTAWALLNQDGETLGFSPRLDLSVVTGAVSAPSAVTATAANQGLLVRWSLPADRSRVAGYQVLCLPRPAVAPAAGYETCGLPAGGTSGIDPADTTQVCSEVLAPSASSVRLSGLVNGTAYTVGVVAIDVSGGTSALSSLATAIPQPTQGFWEEYQQAGGAASGCSVVPAARSSSGLGLWVLLFAVPLLRAGRGRPRRCAWLAAGLVFFAAATAFGQDDFPKSNDDWARAEPSEPRSATPPDYAVEVGLSWYRPAVDQEFGNGARPFADTFSSARHPLWELEVVRYLTHRRGTFGVGLRTGYYKVTAKAFLGDGITRSGDETALRLVPFSPSLVYRATGLPGLRRLPLIPYAKLGLDAAYWTVSTTGSKSQSGLSWGWHGAAGIMLGFTWLGARGNPQGIADPAALFFEWDYAAINGLGMADNLHVGDNTWFAGLMFDI